MPAWPGLRSMRRWPLLTILAMVLTAVYQWGCVVKFLSVSQLPLAMGISLVFAVLLPLHSRRSSCPEESYGVSWAWQSWCS